MGAAVKRFEIELNGKSEPVWAQRIRGVVWFHWRGQTFSIADEEVRTRKGQSGSGSAHSGQIQAPMPGKVTKVFASPGNEVTSGAPLVVMEAMKMEYTLVADITGKIEAVNCKAGDQVALHQLLIKIIDAGASP